MPACRRALLQSFRLNGLRLSTMRRKAFSPSELRLVAVLYIGEAGVPSDHLSTFTRNTAMGGKPLSWGYAAADKYQ